MYQNLDGTQKQPKTLLIVVIILIAIIATVGVTTIVLKSESNNSNETNNYKEETSSNDKKDNEDDKDNEDNEETPTTPEEPIQQQTYSNIEQLTYKSFKDMIKDKRSFVVVISQTYCSHCIAYKPIYNEVLKEHNAKGYDLDIVDLELEEREDILEEYDIEGTPTTIIFIDGILQKERKVGLVEKAELQSYLAMYGFI
jgi:thiol-disulfide isomerase/thioredoxin